MIFHKKIKSFIKKSNILFMSKTNKYFGNVRSRKISFSYNCEWKFSKFFRSKIFISIQFWDRNFPIFLISTKNIFFVFDVNKLFFLWNLKNIWKIILYARGTRRAQNPIDLSTPECWIFFLWFMIPITRDWWSWLHPTPVLLRSIQYYSTDALYFSATKILNLKRSHEASNAIWATNRCTGNSKSS